MLLESDNKELKNNKQEYMDANEVLQEKLISQKQSFFDSLLNKDGSNI